MSKVIIQVEGPTNITLIDDNGEKVMEYAIGEQNFVMDLEMFNELIKKMEKKKEIFYMLGIVQNGLLRQ